MISFTNLIDLNMKKTIIFIAFIIISNLSFSQTFQDEFQLMQSLYGLDKKEIIGQFVDLDPNQEADFWLLYDEYELKRKELGKKKFILLQNYANDYGEIEARDVEMLMKESIPLRKKSDQLIDNYYSKIKKKTDAVVAVQFYQIEHYLSDLIRIKLLEGIYITKKQ